MDLEEFREYCLAKGGVTEGTPFGETVLVFKVAGKIFALAALDEIPATVNLKCDPDVALELRDRYEQIQPGYHMNKKHWNTVEISSGVPEAELRKIFPNRQARLWLQQNAKSHGQAMDNGCSLIPGYRLRRA